MACRVRDAILRTGSGDLLDVFNLVHANLLEPQSDRAAAEHLPVQLVRIVRAGLIRLVPDSGCWMSGDKEPRQSVERYSCHKEPAARALRDSFDLRSRSIDKRARLH